MAKRKRSKTRIPLKTRLAAALLTMQHDPDGTGKLEPIIGYEEAKGLTDKQIIGRFDFDHGIHEAIDGPTMAWNITPRVRAEHRRKTAQIDIPQIAKTKRLERATAQHQGIMLAKSGQAAPDVPPPVTRLPSRKIRSAGFQKPKDGEVRKIHSRGFTKPEKPNRIPRFQP